MISFVKSLIRTYMPMLVGFLAEYGTTVIDKIDVDATPGSITFIVGMLYYLFPRMGEYLGHKNAGLFLGTRSAPKYGNAEDAVIAQQDADLEWD